MLTASVANDEDDFVDVPSCVESLVSSAEQLHQLARSIGEYYIKNLLTYGYAVENQAKLASVAELVLDAHRSNSSLTGKKSKTPGDAKLASLFKNQRVLESLSLTLESLPFLGEINSFVERCLVTIESTLKRSTYHLNKMAALSSGSDLTENFHLTPDARIHSIFIALMDLIFAIVSLDETIQYHTSIKTQLEIFKTICKLVIRSRMLGQEELDLRQEMEGISDERLCSLEEHLSSIQLTLCSKTLLRQILDHFEHIDLILSQEKTKVGYVNLGEHFEEFLKSYGQLMIDVSGAQIDSLPGKSSGSSNYKSLAEYSNYLVNLKLIPTLYMTSTPRKVLGFIGVFLFYQQIFKRKQNKKVFRTVIQILQKFKSSGYLHLIGSNICLKLDEFIANYLPKIPELSKLVDRFRVQANLIQRHDISLELDRQSMRVYPWLMRVRAQIKSIDYENDTIDKSNLYSLVRFIQLIEFGAKVGEEINDFIRSTTSGLRNQNDKSMTKQDLISLLRLVALLKSIESTVSSNRRLIDNSLIRIENFVRIRWRRVMAMAQKRLISTRYSDRRLDTASSLMLTSICAQVEQLANSRGRSSLSICLSMLSSSLANDEIQTLNRLLGLLNIDLISNIQLSLNCGHLFWSWQTFGTYYSNAFESDPGALDELQYFHTAINDIPAAFLVDSNYSVPKWIEFDADKWLSEKRNRFLNGLSREFVEQFKLEFLDRICQELELELHLQTHRDPQSSDSHNPFRRHLYNFKSIFAPGKAPVLFRVQNSLISLQSYVEQHLNRVCYNLTAMAPHDWFTYDSMMNIARHKYHLKFANSQLPAQTLDLGLDLLEITRNLPLFASRYGYDLTNQIFIEKSSNRMSSTASVIGGVGGGGGGGAASMLSSYAASSSNQTLNVIQIRHIAKSIQTHGYGLLNSSVNCTYQTMKRLINLFSKQMSDERLRATLGKEYQHQLELSSANSKKSTSESGDSKNLMSFDKANRMAKKFRFSMTTISEFASHQNGASQSVVTNGSHNYGAGGAGGAGFDLDSLRQTITQLGNLLAFIRALKSGALSCVSKSVDYLPDLDDMSHLRLSRFADKEFGAYESSESLRRAAENFDKCLSDFDENFLPKTNYFGILVDLFTKILSKSPQSPTPPDTSASTDEAANDDRRPSSQSQAAAAAAVDKREHLRLFYIVLPALTINYIDYLINCKERVSSRSSAARFGALISDDGFPMGAAFLLTVLSQTRDFSQFEWFKLVRSKLDEERREVDQRMKDSRYEESLKLTSSVTLRRINRLYNEYTGLDYTLSSALLLFRSSSTLTTNQY